jgi:hypothetical protein
MLIAVTKLGEAAVQDQLWRVAMKFQTEDAIELV